MSAIEEVIILLEQPDGTVLAYRCGSRTRAEKIVDVSPYECLGIVPSVPLSRALGV